MGQRKKKYMKTIGCHFVLPVHKQHNNLNHTMIIEENIVATKYYTNISISYIYIQIYNMIIYTTIYDYINYIYI